MKPGTPQDDATKNAIKRKRAIDELANTETAYVSSLALIFQKVLTVVRDAKKPLLTNEEVTEIFCNWEQILGFHLRVLKEIKFRLAKWDDNQVFGDLFLNADNNQTQSMENIYGIYVANYPLSVGKMTQMRGKQHPFIRWLKIAVDEHLPLGNIEAYLIMPVQRIPRYLMLLKEISNSTAPGHPDSRVLVEGEFHMKKTADKVNSYMGNTDKLDKVRSMTSLIHGFPNFIISSNPGVFVIKQGILSTEKSKYFVSLLPPCLVISSPKNENFNFVCSITLIKSEISVSHSTQGRPILVIRPVLEDKNHNHIFSDDWKDKGASWIFEHPENEGISGWYKAITIALLQARSSMVQFGQVISHNQIADPIASNIARLNQLKELQSYLTSLTPYTDALTSFHQALETDKPPSFERSIFKALFTFYPPIANLNSSILNLISTKVQQRTPDYSAYIIADVFSQHTDFTLFKDWVKTFKRYRLVYENNKGDTIILQVFKLFEQRNPRLTLNGVFERLTAEVYTLYCIISEMRRYTLKPHKDFHTMCYLYKSFLTGVEEIL